MTKGKPKKPYATPRLRTYGDVRQVTRAAQKNNNDDGGPKNFRT